MTSHAPTLLKPEFDEDYDGPLYVARRDIRPRAVSGTYRRIKWALLVLTLGVYYILPFIRWDRGPDRPDQAVLIDLAGRRFYFFFIEIWPQEIYFFTGLLVLAALILFLMNAIAGRVWCGYLCPQTVWTDLFLAVERFFEGDDRDRAKAIKAGWTADRIGRLVCKHAVWLMIAWWTGGAWVLYFSDAPTLVWQLATLQAPFVAYLWIGILTAATYILAGYMREQVCTYMCPWPRIQAALTDEEALNVTYRGDRGEPRLSAKKAAAARIAGQPAGDCVDCGQCVAVCPTGVDIRNGSQLGCIQCGLCIDACDTVMAKVGYAPRLIAYDTDLNLSRRRAGMAESLRFIRPRTILYAAAILAVVGLMLAGLFLRKETGLTVIHDRNPLYTTLSDGSIRNAFTVRVLNKEPEARRFTLTVSGLDGLALKRGDADSPVIEVAQDQTQAARVLVTLSGKVPRKPAPITFTITDDRGTRVSTTDVFQVPKHEKDEGEGDD